MAEGHGQDMDCRRAEENNDGHQQGTGKDHVCGESRVGQQQGRGRIDLQQEGRANHQRVEGRTGHCRGEGKDQRETGR